MCTHQGTGIVGVPQEGCVPAARAVAAPMRRPGLPLRLVFQFVQARALATSYGAPPFLGGAAFPAAASRAAGVVVIATATCQSGIYWIGC